MTKRAETLLRDLVAVSTPSRIADAERHLRLAEAEALESLAQWADSPKREFDGPLAHTIPYEARRRAARLRRKS